MFDPYLFLKTQTFFIPIQIINNFLFGHTVRIILAILLGDHKGKGIRSTKWVGSWLLERLNRIHVVSYDVPDFVLNWKHSIYLLQNRLEESVVFDVGGKQVEDQSRYFYLELPFGDISDYKWLDMFLVEVFIINVQTTPC